MTKDDLLAAILHDFKYGTDSAPLTSIKLSKLFLETCDVCLKECKPRSATCGSKQCVSEIKSRNSRQAHKQGKVSSDRGLSY